MFPSEWKLAKVIPIFKSGSRLDISNYRPISILPVASKILEKHVHKALCEYLETHKLLKAAQSGFRAIHSCETALLKVTDSWMKVMDEGNLVGSIFLDLRKAFDLVDHNSLLRKIQMYKFSPSSHHWFQSYLTNRQQCVSVNERY